MRLQSVIRLACFMAMNTTELDYVLPKDSIAQFPVEDRASSRLLVFNRRDNTLEHRTFRDIIDYLRAGDLLVLNDSKVLPARLKARKGTGGALDILLVEQTGQGKWTCLVSGLRRGLREERVFVGDVEACLTKGEGDWVIEFSGDAGAEVMSRCGSVPLPPYIKRKANPDDMDLERYQTVYAEVSGSIAAPTAGFHFTPGLLDKIRKMGAEIVKITVHIGVGTFRLVKTERAEEHRMHGEHYRVTPEAKSRVDLARSEGRRIIACGTSTVRALETICTGQKDSELFGKTELFIYPGFEFKAVNALITNFHVPRSTPLLLVSAFMGTTALKRCYGEALATGYRFYSYGDAMFII
jgi:S-adenosylmethionine:tRNA ribosyltransferase-isomerase